MEAANPEGKTARERVDVKNGFEGLDWAAASSLLVRHKSPLRSRLPLSKNLFYGGDYRFGWRYGRLSTLLLLGQTRRYRPPG